MSKEKSNLKSKLIDIKKSTSHIDWTSRIALVLSVIAIWLQGWQYFDRKQFDWSFSKPWLRIRIYPRHQKTLTLRQAGGSFIFDQTFKCVLTNTSAIPTSVVEQRLEIDNNGKGLIFYEGFSAQILDQKGQQIQVPYLLASGESRLLTLRLTIRIPKIIASEVADQITLNRPIDIDRLSAIFFNKGFSSRSLRKSDW